MPFQSKPPLSIAVQEAGLRQFCPYGTLVTSASRLRWVGIIQHDETGRPYKVELKYKLNTKPEIFVREPDLKNLTNGRSLPHVYDENAQSLCLYLPNGDYWSADKLLASTIIPWACLWFRYFENWLITDVWHGPGCHPILRASNQKAF